MVYQEELEMLIKISSIINRLIIKCVTIYLLASCPVEEGACLAEEDHHDPSFLVASASYLLKDLSINCK
jgi:hypothetical protein